jgi:DNA-binding NtrC family response regulator
MTEAEKLILLVDNNITDLEILEEMLKEKFEIQKVNTSAEALRMLKEQSYSLVITSLLWPYSKGFEFITYIKYHFPDLPVILVSASFGMISVKREYERYVEACLAKPLNMHRLITAVRRVLGESQEKG